MTTRTIKVDYLARVEGESSLHLKIRDGYVEDARLKIFEAPRFFEALLKDRHFLEAPDITARICGICPVAYQMSAIHAMERAASVTIEGPLRDLRRLLYCGEWISSHTLHIYMLHAPDFLGFDDAIAMARDHGAIVERGLQLKKAGNDIMRLLGGREVHPISARVGGFYAVPKHKDLIQSLKDKLSFAQDAARETVRWAAALPFPNIEVDYEFVSLRHDTEYPMNEGKIVSSRGLEIEIEDYGKHFQEYQREGSTALYSKMTNRGAYLVGPMARFNLNRDHLPPVTAEAAKEAGLIRGCRNPFQSIIVRSLEVLFACEEALRIIEDYEQPDTPYVDVDVRDVTGCAATEAPRGLLYHHYTVDNSGRIQTARIVPPTSQNQCQMELDLIQTAANHLDLSDDELQWRCEQTVRNHDPCISCATHFLKLKIDRT